MRKMSDDGLAFLKLVEGCKLKAYQDSAGIWTIGFGHTKNVRPGDVITMDLAAEFLRQDLAEKEESVSTLITVPLTQHQFDALVSFCYNVGHSALKTSSIRTYINQPGLGPAAVVKDHLTRWNKARVNGVLTPIRGLTRRRLGEWSLWQCPDSVPFDPKLFEDAGLFRP